jgi:RNase P subunit RPR2
MDKEVNIKIVKTMHNKDLIQRVNFLQQASILIASKNTNLSSYYGSLFKKIQKKGQLRV